MFVLTAQASPTTDAAALITANFPTFVSADDGYTGIQTFPADGPTALQPPTGSSIVSFARLSYTATLTDSQGAFPVTGNFYIAVRPDGLVVLINPEIQDVSNWDAHVPEWGPIFGGVLASFGGQTG